MPRKDKNKGEANPSTHTLRNNSGRKQTELEETATKNRSQSFSPGNNSDSYSSQHNDKASPNKKSALAPLKPKKLSKKWILMEKEILPILLVLPFPLTLNFLQKNDIASSLKILVT